MRVAYFSRTNSAPTLSPLSTGGVFVCVCDARVWKVFFFSLNEKKMKWHFYFSQFAAAVIACVSPVSSRLNGIVFLWRYFADFPLRIENKKQNEKMKEKWKWSWTELKRKKQNVGIGADCSLRLSEFKRQRVNFRSSQETKKIASNHRLMETNDEECFFLLLLFEGKKTSDCALHRQVCTVANACAQVVAVSVKPSARILHKTYCKKTGV